MLQWDTAGQERYRALTACYYRHAQGVIIMYDVTDAISFSSVKHWLDQIDKHITDKVYRIIVGNKIDLISQRVVTYEEGKVNIHTAEKGLMVYISLLYQ